MVRMIETARQKERAVLVGIITPGTGERDIGEFLDELEFLADTAGALIIGRFVQRLKAPNPGTFVGTGKINEISLFIKNNSVDLVIFDDDLTPSQFRNIERTLNCRILDRTNLILDIFANRARTAIAKVQVELAQYQYLLPRLTRMWTHLERQRGGIGLRGPGETEIETDRRIIRDKIARLKVQLEKIDRQMIIQRKNRERMIQVALVGYTNVGKSTIMNLLSKTDLFAENKLFATLDTTVRKIVVDNLPFLLTDTVGFIRKLPHGLVESFKSTLDEVRDADILCHVVDISHPNFEDQINVVNDTLKELKVEDKTIVMVFNKIDAYRYKPKEEDDPGPLLKANLTLEQLKNSWMAGTNNRKTIFLSALEKTNIEEFRRILYEEVKVLHQKRYPYNDFLY